MSGGGYVQTRNGAECYAVVYIDWMRFRKKLSQIQGRKNNSQVETKTIQWNDPDLVLNWDSQVKNRGKSHPRCTPVCGLILQESASHFGLVYPRLSRWSYFDPHLATDPCSVIYHGYIPVTTCYNQGEYHRYSNESCSAAIPYHSPGYSKLLGQLSETNTTTIKHH